MIINQVEDNIPPLAFQSFMAKEARESSVKVKSQLINNQSMMFNLGQQIRDYAPKAVMLIGRGSSDHAGSFAKYLIEIETQIPTFAAAPSVSTIYGRRLKLEGMLVIVISQSGKSPDIIEQTRQAKEAGAFCIALVNESDSPLKEIVDYLIPLHAGEEKSVAATKSFILTLSAIMQLVSSWANSTELMIATKQIPDALIMACEAKPQLTNELLDGVNNLAVLGRGLGFAISKEIALKIKEVCAIHAESFSSAEFLHGPVSLLQQSLKLINIQVNDESKEFHEKQIQELIARGANITNLHQCDDNLHPRVAPFAVLQRFYLDIEKIAQEKGLNPDEPVGLKKVTKTI